LKKIFKLSYIKHQSRFILSALVLLLCLCSCQPSLKRFQGSFIGPFDTVTSVVFYCKDEAEFEQYLSFSKAFLEKYHQLYDIYNSYETNNIKTINENAGVKEIKVDKEIIDLLLFCKEAYEKTEKNVNTAMGSVLEIWHEYRQNGINNPENASLPDYSALLSASRHTDFDNVKIDVQNSTVYISDKHLSLDVGAVAKGYAVDMLCSALKEKGLKNGIVSVGGNVKAIGTKLNGKPWSVDIQSPFEQDEIIFTEKIQADTAVTSSGDYQRYYTVDNINYCHIIDPKTLYPCRNFRAVTIISQNASDGDCLSTALFNLSIEEGKELLKKYKKAKAIWILQNGEIIKSY